MTQVIFPLVLMGMFLGYSLYMIQKRKKAMPDATRMFLERTGYRYADILDQPLEAHVHHGERLMKNARKGYRIHMVRNFHDMPIHSLQESTVESGLTSTTTSISYTWSLPLPRPLRFQLQIAEKSLRGFAKGVKEAFSSSERVWDQLYPFQVTTGNAEFDARFNVYSDQPQAAQMAVHSSGLMPLLLRCTEVDLATTGDHIRFSDPMQKNITGVMGGTLGVMAMAANVGKMMELQIPVHELMAQVLATTYQACA